MSAKRFPDYSSVTARESLESLRKRQQQQQQAHQLRIANFPDIDGTYDTINYDQVKVGYLQYLFTVELCYIMYLMGLCQV